MSTFWNTIKNHIFTMDMTKDDQNTLAQKIKNLSAIPNHHEKMKGKH